MAGTGSERTRTGRDLAVGILLLLAASFLLANVVVATAVSVLVLGWTTLACGVVLVVRALTGARSGSSWSAALGGVVLVVLGAFVLRNPVVGALTLTLLTGSLLLATGLTRIFSAPARSDARAVQLVSGLVSAALGLFVLLNLTTATLTLLGVLVGVQLLVEGATLVTAGRLRPARIPTGAPPAAAPGGGRRPV
jgi:membrane protein HdeD